MWVIIHTSNGLLVQYSDWMEHTLKVVIAAEIAVAKTHSLGAHLKAKGRLHPFGQRTIHGSSVSIASLKAFASLKEKAESIRRLSISRKAASSANRVLSPC